MSDIAAARATNCLAPAGPRNDPSVRSRQSTPVTPAAMAVAGAMASGGLAYAIAGHISFCPIPNPAPLIAAVLVFDMIAWLMPDSAIVGAVRSCIVAVLYLAFASIAGILFSYAGQRLGMPLRDGMFAAADKAIGFDWAAFTHWVDRNALFARALHASYGTMALQIALPALILPFMRDMPMLRTYLLAFALALTATAVTAALLPALSPVATIDRSIYRLLDFSGATPLDHLAALRSSDIAVIRGSLGGIISFPSFHATIAILTPLVLRRSRFALVFLLPLDAMMLCATITEGAHYACDVLAGVAVAIIVYVAADVIETRKDTFTRRPGAHGGLAGS